MLPYINPGDQEYATHQVKLHKALCARRRGENVPLPTMAPSTSEEKVEALCSHCGTRVMISPTGLRAANDLRGGPCCKECRYKRQGEYHKRKHALRKSRGL